jgi:hypothetical protein
MGARPRCRIAWLLGSLILIWTGAATAQVDPERRTYLEAGATKAVRGDGPFDGYGFVLLNRPHFPSPDWYFRLVVDLTYLTSELVRDRWPAEGHAVGVGIDGGGFQNNFNEFRGGEFLKTESFWGHGAGASFSYYWRQLKIAGVLPVEGQLRLRAQYAAYTNGWNTGAAFVLPADSAIYTVRAGLRAGGIPPELFPKRALEVSIWHEASYRDAAGRFGLPDQPQETQHFTQKTWARAGGIFTPWLDHSVSVFLTGGVAERADVLSVFLLGGPLPFHSELPLLLHGYNQGEVFAQRFALVNLSYQLAPIPAVDWLQVQVSGDYAWVDYFPGHSLPHRNLTAAGLDVIAAVFKGATLVVGYGYGFDAPRPDHAGAQEVHVLFEKKF